MKGMINRIGPFGLLLILTDFIFIFITWLLRPSAMKSVGIFILLFSLQIFTVAVFLERRRNRKITTALELFLETPNDENKAELVHAAGAAWEQSINCLYDKITSQSERINMSKSELLSYQEFIEAWVHEIKTPLSLFMLVLNNHRDEMSPAVYNRMNHMQRQLGDQVERILYYARSQAEHPDFKFTQFPLELCVQETVDEYVTIANENHISIHLDLQPQIISSDQKILRFMLSQLISNACKYADKENGEIAVLNWKEGDKIHLAVRNNGDGIPPEDAPFIYDKGFTGNHPDRQKATGMGLYLVRKYAEALCIDILLEPNSITGDGFGIELIFTL